MNGILFSLLLQNHWVDDRKYWERFKESGFAKKSHFKFFSHAIWSQIKDYETWENLERNSKTRKK